MKYIAKAMRRNVAGKEDYEWIAKYADNSPILFDTDNEALEYAKSACSDPAHAMYAPSASAA